MSAIQPRPVSTPVRSSEALGRAIRRERRRVHLTQAELATRVARSRQEIIQLEAGKQTRALHLVFDTVATLGLELRITERSA